MIDIWLKIRDRGNLEFLLKHLNFWLSTFSDAHKYRVFLYNENVALPPEYGVYTVLDRQRILINPECKRSFNIIQSSHISPRWKGAAFALTAPYFYLENSTAEYVVNCDSDDLITMGPVCHYIDRAIDIMRQHNLPTLSYDYIFSYNPFEDGGKRMMPHHWTFGLNISHRRSMKAIVEKIFNNMPKYINYIPNINLHMEVNIDILLSSFLLNEGQNYKYFSFITKEGLRHRGFHNFDVYHCKYENGMFHVNFRNNIRNVPLHHKTVFID